jgi:hypothetical protein
LLGDALDTLGIEVRTQTPAADEPPVEIIATDEGAAEAISLALRQAEALALRRRK